MSTNNTEFIKMENICKEFPGVRALWNVQLTINKGEIHALVGENGAGKSTLIKILMGVYQKTSGRIFIDGKEVEINSPLDAQRFGLAAVYQDVTIAPHLSVGENFFLGRLPMNRLGFVDWKRMNQETQKALDELHIQIDARIIVKDLSVAQQEMVIIAKKYFENSRLMVLDEPTALLANEEVEKLFQIIRDLKKRGTSIIYISHRMEEIFEICDRITILKDGQSIDTVPVENVTEELLISKMVGRTISDMYSIRHQKAGEPVLDVRNLTRKGVFENINFTLHKGEILGLFGLVGSGRTEIVRAVFGADPVDSGEIWINSEKKKISNPRQAIAAGIGLLPEDRKNQGLALATSITQNINLASYDKISRLGFINTKQEARKANSYTERLHIVTPGIYQKVVNLSGGNQQKVVIAKWLCRESSIFIFDEPTVGIDVGAKTEIYHLLEELLAANNAIIMISSYLPEIMGLADRIVVIHEGKQTGIVDRSDYDDRGLLKLASGIHVQK